MTSGVFDSFNAKNLTHDQVARTFIPPANKFSQLAQRSHCLVVGPRGSGKTTMLKMLQLPALACWTHRDAPEFQQLVDFVGVFVAADIVWREQMDGLAHGALDPSSRHRLAVATFTTHVFLSLIAALQDTRSDLVSGNDRLSRLHIKITEAQEAELTRILSEAWLLKPTLLSLLGVKLALRQRLADIAALAERLASEDATAQRITIAAVDYLSLSFYEHALVAIEAINGLAGKPDLKWAFLFDELEIAPDFIRKRLLTLLRGADQRILLKLSMAPFNSDFATLFGEIGAKPGHDFLPISLWYSEKEEAIPFAIELCASILADCGVPGASPITALGPSEFEQGRDAQRELGKGYDPGSSNFRKFSDLAARDHTFRQYLSDNDIDLKRMHLIDDARRASIIRKITSVVTVREAYLRHAGVEPGSGQRVRSRKRPQIYAGAASLFAITEGNPRWIIGTLGPLLRSYASDGRTVRREIQSRSIAVASERFRALLSTVSVSQSDGDLGHSSLLNLLDEIGHYFHHGVVVAPFKPEPPTSFIVDAFTPQSVQKALATALNVGAIVFVPDSPGQTVVENLEGKRFRLTYLLAPHYKLPLTIGKSRHLSSILRDVNVSAVTPDLFDGRS